MAGYLFHTRYRHLFALQQPLRHLQLLFLPRNNHYHLPRQQAWQITHRCPLRRRNSRHKCPALPL